MSPISWKGFRNGLQSELFKPTAGAFFNAAKRLHPELSNFDSPETLVEWMLDYSSHSAEEEDVLLKCIWNALNDDEARPFWSSVLALGLWPTLEWVFCRIRPKCADDSEAASEIWSAFELCLADRTFPNRPIIAKRLMTRVWTLASRSLDREKSLNAKLRKSVEALPECDMSAPFCVYANKKDEPPSKEELYLLQRMLVDYFDLPERDALAVVLHAVSGKSHAEIAALIGSSEAATRQRYCRALKKVQKKSKNAVTLSRLNEMGKERSDEKNALDNSDGRFKR